MINADKQVLNSFFSSNLQYVVPFFQRSYVWDKENWETLWDHLSEIQKPTVGSSQREHFIGTLITKQRNAETLGEQRLDVIDGQQRLTTIALLIKAIADRASGQEPYSKLKPKANELVVFENARGEEFFRIEHSRNDRAYFEAVMTGSDLSVLKKQDHKVLKCYRYFWEQLDGYTDEELDELKTIILSKVPVISMLLAATDDEQEIFDTINSLGVRLTSGELLKNYVFKEKEIQGMYESHWQNIFEEDDDVINFWNRTKVAGRVPRANIEMLLYCYLIIETRSDKLLNKLFSEYRTWLAGKDLAGKMKFLGELKAYATIYFKFPEGQTLNQIGYSEHEARFFHIIENLDITTAYPLILYIYKNVSVVRTRAEMLKMLESYLVRRNVCRLTTKNYNNVFIQIINKLEESDNLDPLALRTIISGFTEDTNRKPGDDEFKAAFAEAQVSNSNANEILYCICLYNASNPKNDVSRLTSSTYSVEHLMPIKWETNWSLPNMDEAFKINRNKRVKTLGNMTLVTQSLNSSMKNASWVGKTDALKEYSSMKITTDYVDLPKWDESTIEARAGDLAKVALKIWPA